jgi:hypothetical protein
VSGSAGEDATLLASLEDTGLYSIGAYFSDRHPELVDDVLAQSEEIEAEGLARWAARQQVGLESAYQTLMTGLAVRYFKAVAGSAP